MQKILLLVAVWCYSWMAVAIDGKWSTTVLKEQQFGNRAWWAAWNSEGIASGQGQFSSDDIDVQLEISHRTIPGVFCRDGICGEEHKYILTINSDDSLHQEKIAIMTREKDVDDRKLVLDVDVDGEKVVGDFDHTVGTTLRFTHWDRRVLMNIKVVSFERWDRRIILTIARSDGHPFQWLGHEVEMVTLSAHLFPAKDLN